MSQKVSTDVSQKVSQPPLSVAQFRGARGLLGWSQTDLAQAAGLSLPTIKRVELETVQVSDEAREKMRSALESAGVIFVAENGEGPGVRLRKTPPDPGVLESRAEALEEKAAALDTSGPPSPKKALNTMKKAVAKNEATKLRNKLAKTKSGKN